ncbi:HNH endonuclease [Vibrio vulnificus]|uniref:HNH endonuclease n=1 Tax=Vibrio vulnificus TaxID=672 RepID=UPI00307D9401
MTTCIICLGEKEISKSNPLSVEHIIPEFVGGTLTVKNVCKSCNSAMGDGFEGKLANSFEFKVPRYFYGLAGKNKNVPNPFIGNFENEQIGRFSVKNDLSIITTPQLTFNASENGVEFEIKVDKSEVHKAREMLAIKLKRYLKSQGKVISNEKLLELVELLLSNAKIHHSKVEKPQVKTSAVMNVNHHYLLYIKIAYELAVFHFGNDYLTDPKASALRQALRSQKIDSSIEIFIPEKSDFGIEYDEDFHWVIFYQGSCFISIFGMLLAVKFSDVHFAENSSKVLVYKFDFKNGNYSHYERILEQKT